MQYLIDTETSKLHRLLKPIAVPTDSDESALTSFIDRLGYQIPFDTGLLPLNGSGLLSYRQAEGYVQIIYQFAPQKKIIKWGEYECDVNAGIYELAMPWYIVIIDFKDGYLLGARHFYSVEPIYDWQQQLYAVNLPNTNTLGYGGTSIGWICLYHTMSDPLYRLEDIVNYTMTRVNGLSEPYNTNNMSDTDGPRFYSGRNKKPYLYDPSLWADKTKMEGISWICDPNLLIPLHTSENKSDKYVEGGVPYTLWRASNEGYSAYYDDSVPIKPHMPGYQRDFDNLFGNMSNYDALAPTFDVLKRIHAAHLTPYKHLLADIRKCIGCSKSYPTSIQFQSVVISYDHIDADGDLIDAEYNDWCPECVEQWSVKLDFFNALFMTEILASLDNGDGTYVYDLDENAYTCNMCHHAYTEDGFNRRAVFRMTALDSPTPYRAYHCCTACATEEIVKPKTEPFYYLKSSCDEFEVATLQVVDNELVLVKSYEYYPKGSGYRQCKCGLVLNSSVAQQCQLDEQSRCKSCVNPAGEYSPVIQLSDIRPLN